jgi:hypothetical protein
MPRVAIIDGLDSLRRLGRLAGCACGAGALAVVASATPPVTELMSGDRSSLQPASVLVERPSCDGAERDAMPPGERLPGGQEISVSVPATALLRLDGRGVVVAATTNTGCAPRPTDQVFGVRTDGTVDPLPPSTVTNVRWVGDFTEPGVLQAQSPG